jgi:DNA-directed RNA polymerase specialized sigma24 family protein
LLELLEPELRRLARVSLRRTPGLERRIQPDELVNEAYLRLQQYLGTRQDVSFDSRRLFVGMVLKVMRHVLLDLAKRGGDSKPQSAELMGQSTATLKRQLAAARQCFEVQVGPGMPDSP